jgi:glycosyltransferase involved in cell wall biosynthesis
LPARLPELKSWAKYFYFPATQDADQFGGTWMPFGIDTTMFNPALNPAGGHETDKKYNLGFIGSLYQSRKNYLEKLSAGAGDDLSFNLGQVFVQDLSGVLPKESTLLLAENYRQIKVFFCLPPISRLIIEKVFEVMACGTFVMYPKLPGAAAENLSIFEHGKEIVYYEPGYMADNIKQIRYYLAHEDEREHIAAAGCKKVHELYRLDKMLEKMLEARPTL